MIDMSQDYLILPPGTTASIVPPIMSSITICTDSLFTVNRNTGNISHITFPTPKVELIDISCPKCGSSRYRKTDIKNVVECEYCGSRFGVKYEY